MSSLAARGELLRRGRAQLRYGPFLKYAYPTGRIRAPLEASEPGRRPEGTTAYAIESVQGRRPEGLCLFGLSSPASNLSCHLSRREGSSYDGASSVAVWSFFGVRLSHAENSYVFGGFGTRNHITRSESLKLLTIMNRNVFTSAGPQILDVDGQW